MRNDKITNIAIGLLLFAIVFLFHSTSRLSTSTDSQFIFHVALSIIREKNTDINEYASLILMEENNYRIIKINGNYYNFFPIGPALVSLPFVFILDKIYPLMNDGSLHQYFSNNTPHQEQHFFASFITALSVYFIYLITLKKTRKKIIAILISLIFAFCTSAWSTASQTLWQHGPSMLLLSTTLYLFILSQKNPKLSQYTAITLALSYIVRPTNSIPILLFTILMIIQYKKYFLKYCLWGMAIAIPFILSNISIYHAILPPYYLFGRIGIGDYIAEALFGALISPSRGLFIFSPILLFSIYGIRKKIKEKQFNKLDVAILSIIILHWIAISSFHCWWGGHSFGPRFFTDILPFLIYFLIPAWPHINAKLNWKNTLYFYVFIFCVAISFFIHYRGANFYSTWAWNEDNGKLWDWRDPQFLR